MSQQGIGPQWNSGRIENTRFMETDDRKERRKREQPARQRGVLNPMEVLTEKSGCRRQPRSLRVWALPADCRFARLMFCGSMGVTSMAPEMGN